MRASLQNPGDRPHLEAHPEVIELSVAQIKSGLVFVAERDGSVLGFVALLEQTGKTIDLDGLFVEPTHWRRGIGRALVDHAVLKSREHAHRQINLVANPHALEFYKSCWFEERGMVATRFGPGVLMTRAL
ncbi:MAG: GNAT family N-acetyltransferase [Micropepsaceae bacterium]